MHNGPISPTARPSLATKRTCLVRGSAGPEGRARHTARRRSRGRHRTLKGGTTNMLFRSRRFGRRTRRASTPSTTSVPFSTSVAPLSISAWMMESVARMVVSGCTTRYLLSASANLLLARLASTGPNSVSHSSSSDTRPRHRWAPSEVGKAGVKERAMPRVRA